MIQRSGQEEVLSVAQWNRERIYTTMLPGPLLLLAMVFPHYEMPLKGILRCQKPQLLQCPTGQIREGPGRPCPGMRGGATPEESRTLKEKLMQKEHREGTVRC